MASNQFSGGITYEQKNLMIMGSFGVIIILLMIICGMGFKPVSDSQIKSDIVESERIINCFYSDFIPDSEYKLKKYNLIKRQTNKDQKEDIVFCQFELENEYLNIAIEAELYYVFYDEGGWILEDVSLGNAEAKPISAPDMNMVFDYIKSEQPEGRFIVENDPFGGVANYGELKFHDSSFDGNTATLTVLYESPIISIYGTYVLDFYPEIGQYTGWVIRCYEDDWYAGKPALEGNYTCNIKYNSFGLGNYSGIIIREVSEEGVLFDSPINDIYNMRVALNPITGGFTLNRDDYGLFSINLDRDVQIIFSHYSYDPFLDVWSTSIDEANLIKQ